jgi:hypothetical protein
MDELGHLGWVAHQSYELEGLMFGIRTDSTVFAGWLAEVLPATLVTDQQANPNYSILIGPSESKVGKRFHILYRDSTPLIRTLDVADLVRTLLGDLDTLNFWRRKDAVYVQATFLSAGGVDALFPAELVGDFEGIKRHVRGKGLKLPGSRYVAIDLENSEALPPPRSLQIDDGAISELARLIGSQTEPETRAVLDRPTAIDLVCTMTSYDSEPIQPVSRGRALYVLGSLAANLKEVGSTGLAALARLVEGAACWEIAGRDPRVVVDSVLNLFQIVGTDTNEAAVDRSQ